MSEFILYQGDISIGMAFNEVAAQLKKRDDVKMLEAKSIDSPRMGMIVIETSEDVAWNLRGAFPGWSISPNYKIGPA